MELKLEPILAMVIAGIATAAAIEILRPHIARLANTTNGNGGTA